MPASESGLLTTADYVRKKMAGQDFPDIVRGVQKIMGSKYSEEAIAKMVQALISPNSEG